MKATLNLTHRCNLSCMYCYAGRKFKKDMSLATAQKIADFVMDITPQGRKIKFGFSGGEPLLRFDLMTEIIDYIRNKERKNRKLISFSVTSNGTLLTEPILDFFREESIDLCISIDGPAHVHNLNRCYDDGQGKIPQVERKIHSDEKEN